MTCRLSIKGSVNSNVVVLTGLFCLKCGNRWRGMSLSFESQHRSGLASQARHKMDAPSVVVRFSNRGLGVQGRANAGASSHIGGMDADFLAQPAEHVGRNAKHALEGARKMKLVAETGAFGNLLDQ